MLAAEAAKAGELAGRSIREARRLAGQKITGLLVSMTDPDARPIRKGKLRQPTAFGTVMQVTELCENTRRGARGLILPLATQIGSPNESDLLPASGAHLHELGIQPREIALDGGFAPGPVADSLPPPDRLFIRRPPVGRLAQDQPAPGEVPRRLRRPHQPPQAPRRHGSISPQGPRWRAAWAILAYNFDILAIRAR
jgi:hypothetical protein